MMPTTNPKKSDLVTNEKGAIMIMGLAMILALIAFLWFLLGIGETLAFRDHMQESADSATFTQSAVNALGMNLIVLINLVMMIMVAIYVGYSVYVTGLWISSVVCCPDIWTALECCPRIFTSYYPGWKDRNSFAKDEAQVYSILSPLESGIAILAPWAGTGLSIVTSHTYKLNSMSSAPLGVAGSHMNIPSISSLSDTSGRYGLPVTHELLGNDCAHLVDAIGGLVGGILPSGASSVVSGISNIVGKVVQWYYCSDAVVPGMGDGYRNPSGDYKTGGTDSNGNTTTTTQSGQAFDPQQSDTGGNIKNGTSTAGGVERLLIGGGDGGNYWNLPGYGPMMNYGHTDDGHDKEYKNNSDMMQSYSVVVIPDSYSDHSATHNIKFMQLHNAGWSNGETTKGTVYGYYAESELYFDCDDKWDSVSCDDVGSGITRMDMAMYKFEWRARLVKFHGGGGAFSMLSSALGGLSSIRSFINTSQSNPFVSFIQSLDSELSGSLMNLLTSFTDPMPGTPAH